MSLLQIAMVTDQRSSNLAADWLMFPKDQHSTAKVKQQK